MQTNEQRMERIQCRTEQIRKKRNAQKELVRTGLLCAASFAVVILLGIFFPKNVMPMIEDMSVAYGAASMLSDHSALGYVVMGALSFLLGMLVTVLLYRMRSYDEKKREARSDEL